MVRYQERHGAIIDSFVIDLQLVSNYKGTDFDSHV